MIVLPLLLSIAAINTKPTFWYPERGITNKFFTIGIGG